MSMECLLNRWTLDCSGAWWYCSWYWLSKSGRGFLFQEGEPGWSLCVCFFSICFSLSRCTHYLHRGCSDRFLTIPPLHWRSHLILLPWFPQEEVNIILSVTVLWHLEPFLNCNTGLFHHKHLPVSINNLGIMTPQSLLQCLWRIACFKDL